MHCGTRFKSELLLKPMYPRRPCRRMVKVDDKGEPLRVDGRLAPIIDYPFAEVHCLFVIPLISDMHRYIDFLITL
jgi:hypothetical protein